MPWNFGSSENKKKGRVFKVFLGVSVIEQKPTQKSTIFYIISKSFKLETRNVCQKGTAVNVATCEHNPFLFL